MTVYGIMYLILYLLEKEAGGWCVTTLVNSGSIDIGQLLVKVTLA